MASSSSAKRPRIIINDDEIVTAVIYLPDAYDEWNDIAPDEWKVSISFRVASNPTFFNVWVRMKSWLIYAEGESAPISDLDIPLEDLVGKRLRARAWTPADKQLEDTLNHECDKRMLRILDDQIATLATRLSAREKARQLVSARINNYHTNFLQ